MHLNAHACIWTHCHKHLQHHDSCASLILEAKGSQMRQHILRLIAAASPVVVLQKTQSCVLVKVQHPSIVHQYPQLRRVSSLKLSIILAWAGSSGYRWIQWIPVLAFNLHESSDLISRSYALVIHPRFVTGPCWESGHDAIARAHWQRQGPFPADVPSKTRVSAVKRRNADMQKQRNCWNNEDTLEWFIQLGEPSSFVLYRFW